MPCHQGTFLPRPTPVVGRRTDTAYLIERTTAQTGRTDTVGIVARGAGYRFVTQNLQLLKPAL